MLSDQLLFGDNLGPPQPYIPTFYQFCGQIGECLAAEVGELLTSTLCIEVYLTSPEHMKQLWFTCLGKSLSLLQLHVAAFLRLVACAGRWR